MKSTHVCGLLLVLSLACGSSKPETETPSRVHNEQVLDAKAGASITLDEDLVIVPRETSEHIFGKIVDAAVDDSGDILVLDEGFNHVARWSDDGKFSALSEAREKDQGNSRFRWRWLSTPRTWCTSQT
jgi:hypothetical protein